MITYVNGEYVAAKDAKLSVFDRGFIYGDAVFDATRTFNGRPFDFEQHLARFSRSLRYIELDPDPIVAETRDAVTEVLARSAGDVQEAGDVLIFFYATRRTRCS